MKKVLLIDSDSTSVLEIASLVQSFHHLITRRTLDAARKAVTEEKPAAVLLNYTEIHKEDTTPLKRFLEVCRVPLILLVAECTEQRVLVKAVNAGIQRMVTLPLTAEELHSEIKRAVLLQEKGVDKWRRLNQELKQQIIGESREVMRAKKLIHQFSRSDKPVIITGESGTGKELAARAIHAHSQRNRGPFLPLNCGAIPTNLVESELFGSRRGAFTGAENSEGAFLRADKGTLFLDEIGTMAAEIQVKLLRVLENKVVRPLGGRKAVPCDVRIISATNGNLKEMVKEGRFRQDLYYRINTLPIQMPPLRSRTEDIPMILGSLLRDYPSGIAPEAIEKLNKHPWPGNIRELRNVIDRARLRAEAQRIEAWHIDFD